MDIKIENGDYLLYDGRPLCIFGTDEILQRVSNRLRLKKGSVFFNEQIGSRLHLILNGQLSYSEQLLFELCKEALCDMPDVTLLNASSKMTDNNIFIKLNLSINNKTLSTEVTI